MSESSGSSQHILISYAEYERLKSIEKEFEQLQKGVNQKLQIPSKKGYKSKLKNLVMYVYFKLVSPIFNDFFHFFRFFRSGFKRKSR